MNYQSLYTKTCTAEQIGKICSVLVNWQLNQSPDKNGTLHIKNAYMSGKPSQDFSDDIFLALSNLLKETT